MKLAELMQNPRLKVQRANRHIQSLIDDSTPLSRNLYEIVQVPARTHALLTRPDRFELTYRPLQPIREHFGAIMGDAVNNLRESLDYWIRGAVKCVSPKRNVHFPFSEERKDLETSKFYPAIQKYFPDLADFISNKVQPCRDTNLHLWAVTSLCNENKHNDFLPTVATTGIKNINVSINGHHVMQDCSVSGDADRRFVIISAGGNCSVQENYQTAIEIAFPLGAIFEKENAISTLQKMAEIVSDTLDSLELFATNYCD